MRQGFIHTKEYGVVDITNCKPIFALAVHTNVLQTGVAEQQFVDNIMSKLCDEGILFFESHNLINDRQRFDRICDIFIKSGMKVLERENYFSDFDRDIVVMKK